MARIRSIKPEFFADETLAGCSAHARLLAIALLQLCDSRGVFRNIPMQVHAHAFPWEAMVNIPALLGELEGIGYVKTYRAGGKNYGFIDGFVRHQRLSGKEASSEGIYPTPAEADEEKQEVADTPLKGSDGEESGASQGSGGMPRNREQGTGKEEQGTGNKGSCAEPKNSSAPNEDEVLISVPLNTGADYPIHRTQVAEWTALYPAIDVLQSLRDCRGWNLANPKKRKTKGGILRHINGWLARDQDKGPQKTPDGGRAGAGATSAKTRLAHDDDFSNRTYSSTPDSEIDWLDDPRAARGNGDGTV